MSETVSVHLSVCLSYLCRKGIRLRIKQLASSTVPVVIFYVQKFSYLSRQIKYKCDIKNSTLLLNVALLLQHYKMELCVYTINRTSRDVIGHIAWLLRRYVWNT